MYRVPRLSRNRKLHPLFGPGAFQQADAHSGYRFSHLHDCLYHLAGVQEALTHVICFGVSMDCC